jgi:CRP-like cAMP-binding protein
MILASLARTALLQQFERHTLLVPSSLVTLVLRGHVAVFQPHADGRRQLLTLVPPGEFLGALSVARGSIQVDLVGLEEGLASRWRPEAFRAAAERDPALAMWLLDRARVGTTRLYERVERDATKDVLARLAEVLWRYRGVLFGRPRPLLSRDELAELVGATREMTMRAMRELERSGIVQRVAPSRIELLDVARLRAVCGCADGEITPGCG